MTPAISIIIAAYNAALHLEATLQSVLAQTYNDWECIIVDDGSTDNTAEIANKYVYNGARFRVVTQKNAGVSAARNTGIAHMTASTKYVIFLDSDDVWDNTALQDLEYTLTKHPEAVGVHGIASYIKSDGTAAEYDFSHFGRERYGYLDGKVSPLRPDQPTTFASFLMRFTLIPPGTTLVRRAALQQAGAWDTNLTIGEDWEMFGRISRGGNYVFLDKCIIKYRKHETNASAVVARSLQKRFRYGHAVRHILMFSSENSAEQQKIAVASYKAWAKHLKKVHCTSALHNVKICQWKAGIRDLLFVGLYAISDVCITIETFLHFYHLRRSILLRVCIKRFKFPAC